MEETFHLQVGAEDIGRYVFLPGDPGRVETIAARLAGAKYVHQNREFMIYTGELSGTRVSVVSTGIGGPSAAIAMEELTQLGAHTFLRIGTCGAVQPELAPGTLILPTGAVRMEGTTREYMPIEFPAVPDFTLLSALVKSAEAAGFPYQTGIVQCKDSFYGQHAPESMPVGNTLLEKWKAWIAGGVLGSEMESAALFVVAAVRHVRCATVLQTLWNQVRTGANTCRSENAHDDMSAAIDVAVEAMKIIIAQDGGDGNGSCILCGG